MKRYRFDFDALQSLNGLDIDIPKTGEYVRVDEVLDVLGEMMLMTKRHGAPYSNVRQGKLQLIKLISDTIRESDLVDVSEEEHQ